MRRQTCVTLDEETHRKIILRLKGKKFRSKSHFIELAVEAFLGDSE